MNIKHRALIKEGKLIPSHIGKFKEDLAKFEGKEVFIQVSRYSKLRSQAQNRALHLYFNILAEELNAHGLDMKSFLKVEISWNGLMVKELLWKPLQKIQLGEKSTTKLKTDDINKIYDVLNKVISDRSGGNIQVAFPCVEELFKEDF